MPARAKSAAELYAAQVAANQQPQPVYEHPVTIAMEIPDEIPDNFDELPAEEQERIKNRIRFRGIRLRSDIDGDTVPITRETLDLP